MGLVIKNNNSTVTAFLEKISSLDYEKKEITLQIEVLCDDSIPLVLNWCRENQEFYKSVLINKNSSDISKTKESYLKNSKGHDWLFIVESDVFLRPFTLKHLIKKQLPVIAPFLRPIPRANDPYRTFYLGANSDGFYQFTPNEIAIADRMTIGTFKADCVHGAYLIKTEHVDNLTFKGNNPWSFICFSNSARKNNIPQYICNEREFGFFIHHDGLKDIPIPFLSQEINRKKVKEIVKVKDDVLLSQYLDTFPIDVYSLYPVSNDVYWVDEKWDWVKGHYIKKGLRWEPHIEEVLKKYVKPGDTVIDIGGHIGTHTINLSRLVGENGCVHVFEPQRKIYTEMMVNTAINSCKNIESHRFALGQADKNVEIIHPCSTNEGMACIGVGGEKVRMKRLDDFNIHNISFIKIDIEGHEIEALKGGVETIQRSKPVMVVEVFRNAECEEKLNYIKSLGYHVALIEDNDYLCLPISHP